MKEKWDPSKSAAANLEALGLKARPNEERNKRNATTTTTTHPGNGASDTANETTIDSAGATGKSIVLEIFDVPESDHVRGRQGRYPLKEEEEAYIARCMEKHGDNYRAMFWDTKTNYLQHTETFLRKLGARYLLLTPEQRRSAIPENIRDLLPSSG